MKKMMIGTKPIFLTILVLNIVLVLTSLYIDPKWLLNSQIAFFSSLFVTISSFLSYKRVIKKRLESGVYEDRDDIDKIEDRFDLYSDEEDVTAKTLKEVIKEERAKQAGFKKGGENLIKSAGGIFNPLRLISYVVLFVGFIYLVNSKNLLVLPYLLGVLVVPFGALIGSLFIKDHSSM